MSRYPLKGQQVKDSWFQPFCTLSVTPRLLLLFSMRTAETNTFFWAHLWVSFGQGTAKKKLV